ncbi:MAG: phosphate ABC transporter permease PstA [Gammaproteobacteria bacterium TMED243]|nr:phosphate ABC transporter, permease protein PstA [Gammaproteobacteria bacterium]RPG32193.1 MAG: phosphate ABC transporter permease PstA [Gammaproteobacteria bacterium TMED243]
MKNKPSFFQRWFASGEPWIWLNAAAVGISVTAVVGILLLLAVKGLAHFWPSDIALIQYETESGQPRYVYGELIEQDTLPVQQFLESGGPEAWVDENAEVMQRWLVKTGNRKISAPDFRWIYQAQIQSIDYPSEVVAIERLEWGNAYGVPISMEIPENLDGTSALRTVIGDGVTAAIAERLTQTSAIRDEIDSLEGGVLNRINNDLERLRLERRRIEMAGIEVPRLADIVTREDELRAEYATSSTKLRALYAKLNQGQLLIETAEKLQIRIKVSDVLHTWQPNPMTGLEKSGLYLSNLWRFLSENPREANTEGGVFPAIFGTILMVLLMSLIVTPFGVIAAVYLREYAKQGPLVRIIRVAVNNLAGVPSIVYGVFGLGFFVYFLGGNIDQLFYPEALPAPTFGTPGLMWASLTLALLTVPVVIVSTEEGLTRIPRSLREGSMALGATQAETLFKVILPMASPAILTGVILAVARAAGEVAPLMLVGVVKLAPTLPLDASFPYLHLDRKFMHLGFHIYDVGFQSPNVEAARPLVYATALLLVTLIVALNLTAITLRGRLERLYRGVES